MTRDDFNHDSQHSDELPASKSQRKREMNALQDLGEDLAGMSDKQLRELPLPAPLREAIEEYKRLPNKHGARKRQLQFIGRVMREVDEAPIREALARREQDVQLERRRLHRLEALRERLLSGDEEALSWLIANNPAVEIQHVRQLIRQAQKEQQGNKPPAASRKLFRHLRDTVREG